MQKHLPLLVLAFLASATLFAQSLKVEPQSLALFPGRISNLTIIDGELYASSNGLFLHLPRISGSVAAAVGDTSWNGLAQDLCYAVRNPRSGNLFFVTSSKHGTALYEQIPRAGKSPKNVKVRLEDAKNISIEHPVFSPDGTIMVFATDKRIGLGGSDLWYSEFDSLTNRWGRPVNLGSRINSPGDEASPAFVGDFLLFASRNRTPHDSVFSLYATRFRAEKASDDTARRNTIGLSPVRKLPAPINSSADDYEVVADSAAHALYWLSRRNGSDALYLALGALRCACVHGRVATVNGDALPNARILCSDPKGASCETVTDAAGCYQFLLDVGRFYHFSFSADTCFSHCDSLLLPPSDQFMPSFLLDASLDFLPMDSAFRCLDLFSKASADFSPQGLAQLRRLARFFASNPNVSVSFSLSSASFGDLLLDKLLSDARIQALQAFFNLPESRANFSNSTYSQSRLPGAKESELEVILHYNE